MSVLVFDDVDNEVRFTPISAALAALSNGAGTIATLTRIGGRGDIVGLVDSGMVNWFHTVGVSGTNKLDDDDNHALITATNAVGTSAASADNYRICGVDWASGAGSSSSERFHWSGLIGSAEAWTHDATAATPFGTFAGTTTSGRLRIGSSGTEGPFLGEIALVAIWAGVRFTDTDWTNLWVSKQTSDWWNHSAGQPTTLIELNTLTPVDIGANPSTLNTVIGGTLTGADPTGWTFDGQGGAAPEVRLPDGDVITTGWTTTPLYSKLADSSDATVITGTLA